MSAIAPEPTQAQAERKGLRFEVIPSRMTKDHSDEVAWVYWGWVLIGAGDVAYARCPKPYASEQECRSAISKVRGKLAAAKRAKVVTVLEDA